MKEQLGFLYNFVKSPLAIGAIAPSSKFLARQMVASLDLDRAETVVELGPGTGAFTQAILEAISPRALFLAIEANPAFARSLRHKFAGARIIEGSAEALATYLKDYDRRHADGILCGLPWASFSPALQEKILQGVLASLPPGGCFATFAYIHALWFPTARRFRRLLESHFSEVRPSPIVWRNLPPAFVYRCRK